MEYIYVLKDPITGKYMYVGKSKNPNNRFKQHLTSSKKRKTFSQIWINNLVVDGLKPIMEIIDKCGDKEIFKLEKKWILHYYC